MLDIGTFMQKQLFPMIEEKADKNDVDRLERKLDVLSAKTIKHDQELIDIKSLPVIVHELKLKK